MNVARVWFDTALSFVGLVLVMALLGYGTGNAISGHGFEAAVVASGFTVVILAVTTIRKPSWLGKMLEESRKDEARQAKKRSLALIGEVKGDKSVDSSQIYFLIVLIGLLLSFANELNPYFYWIALFVLTKKLVSIYRVTASMLKRVLGLLVAPTVLCALYYISIFGSLRLEDSALVLMSGIVLASVVDEAYVLWQDVKRSEKMRAQLDLLTVLQSRNNQLYMQ